MITIYDYDDHYVIFSLRFHSYSIPSYSPFLRVSFKDFFFISWPTMNFVKQLHCLLPFLVSVLAVHFHSMIMFFLPFFFPDSHTAFSLQDFPSCVRYLHFRRWKWVNCFIYLLIILVVKTWNTIRRVQITTRIFNVWFFLVFHIVFAYHWPPKKLFFHITPVFRSCFLPQDLNDLTL